LLAGGVLRRDDPEVGGQAVGVIKPLELTTSAQIPKAESVLMPRSQRSLAIVFAKIDSAASCSSSASMRSRRASSTS